MRVSAFMLTAALALSVSGESLVLSFVEKLMKKMVFAGFMALAWAGMVGADAPTSTVFTNGETVVFLGDSITQQAHFIRFITDFYLTRYPERAIRWVNAGIAGNSMDGGKNCVSNDVAPYAPTTVAVMYGMNDAAAAGPYHEGYPDGKEREKQLNVAKHYVRNTTRLAERLREHVPQAKLLFLTPSIYESARPDAKGRPVNPGWNGTLGLYSDFLRAAAATGAWEVADIHSPMTEFNRAQQEINPKFSAVSPDDRVHPNAGGGFFMAWSFLKAQGVSPVVSDITLDAAAVKTTGAENAEVSALKKTADGYVFTVLEKALPFPVAKDAGTVACRIPSFRAGLNREWFRVKGLAKGLWTLVIDGEDVYTASSGEFGFGVNLALNDATPQMRQALTVTALNKERHACEAEFRAWASVRWWLALTRRVADPDDMEQIKDWASKNDLTAGWYQKNLLSYIGNWPKRAETRAKIDAMDRELDALRKPVPHVWSLRLRKEGEFDYVPAKDVTATIDLFNGKDLTGWYTYVVGRGRDSDPKNVFTVKDGTICISGVENGCITSQDAYRNYRLEMEYRWVGKGSGGRSHKSADSGLLFHSQGPDGTYYGTWKWSFEYNVIQGRTADLITVVSGNYATPPEPYTYKATVDVDRHGRWDPKGTAKTVVNAGHLHNRTSPPDWKDRATNPVIPPEKPMGEWNTAEIVCKGDTAVFLLNGEVMLKARDLSPAEGQIQIQSEGHGVEIRRITIKPL